jgi:hypothetical protein
MVILDNQGTFDDKSEKKPRNSAISYARFSADFDGFRRISL